VLHPREIGRVVVGRMVMVVSSRRSGRVVLHCCHSRPMTDCGGSRGVLSVDGGRCNGHLLLLLLVLLVLLFVNRSCGLLGGRLENAERVLVGLLLRVIVLRLLLRRNHLLLLLLLIVLLLQDGTRLGQRKVLLVLVVRVVQLLVWIEVQVEMRLLLLSCLGLLRVVMMRRVVRVRVVRVVVVSLLLVMLMLLLLLLLLVVVVEQVLLVVQLLLLLLSLVLSLALEVLLLLLMLLELLVAQLGGGRGAS